MQEDRPGPHRRFTDWFITGHNDAIPLLEELLTLPVAEWEAWLAAHPDAWNVHVFQGLIQAAEDDPTEALAMTDFVIRHADSITVPPEGDVALIFMRWEAWKARAQALRSAGDPAGASQAQEQADALFRTERVLRIRTDVPPTKDDERRAEELIAKYGWKRMSDED